MRYRSQRLVTLLALLGSVACQDQSVTEPGTVASQQSEKGSDKPGNSTGSDTIGTAAGPVVKVRVQPSLVLVYVGDRVGFFASGLNAEGKVVASRPVTWSTSDDKVMSIDNPGVARAVSAGKARIVATIDGVAGGIDVEVGPSGFVASFSVRGIVYGFPNTTGDSSNVTRERVAGATVRFFTYMTATFDTIPTPVLTATATTDANGTFTVRDLPSAYYSVRVEAPAGSKFDNGVSGIGPQRVPEVTLPISLRLKR